MNTQTSQTSNEYLDKIWTKVWEDKNIIDSIKAIRKDENMRWKLKYAPTHGKILEAGCGVGQYVMYFKKLGFDIEGIDISKEAVINANKNSEKMGFGSNLFKIGDVRKLPYENNSLSYYLSMGVIEHFVEGPDDALKEAYRVLKPGGIAYIATPTKYSLAHANSFIRWMFEIDRLPRRFIKQILLKINYLETDENGWIENLWNLNELKTFIKRNGFLIVDCANTGLKSTFDSNLRPSKKKLNSILTKSKRLFYPLLDNYEDGQMAKYGLNNIVVAIKPHKEMHCFFCDTIRKYTNLNLGKYSVPICQECCEEIPLKITNNYIFGRKPFFAERCYSAKNETDYLRICKACNSKHETDEIFGDYGFSNEFCKDCIKKTEILLDEKVNGLKYENI